VYTAFPCSDYYAPSDSPLWHRAFAKRYPLATSPLRFPSPEESPVFPMSDSHKMAEVARSSLSHPRSVASQYRERVGRLVSPTFCSIAPAVCIGFYAAKAVQT
jgi:hypothetical protein